MPVQSSTKERPHSQSGQCGFFIFKYLLGFHPKPMRRRSKQVKRAQGAWETESQTEQLLAKWTVEGVVKKQPLEYSTTQQQALSALQ
ncbi:MAG TPA: hypothetical protein DCP87_01080 [Lactobacillus sp.]|jgi:hypothetical protein|nr:hypothetical protein [Lactobacillus sp.]